MTYNLDLLFSSNNSQIKMNKSSDFKVLTISGLEASSYTINKLESNQDGMTVTGKKVEPREIRITGDIAKNEREDINREKIRSFFSPKYTGELVVNRNNVKRKINYEVSSFSFVNSKMADFMQFEITLECTNPFFRSIDNFGKNIALITKQFAFPLGIIKNKGKIMGYRTFKSEVPIINDGDLPTGIQAVLKATRGSVLNPKIILNDKYIEVFVNMQLKDELVINTNARKKGIYLNGQNIINKINRKSAFFDMDVGGNVLKYNAEDGYINLDVNIYFDKIYLGM